MKSTTVFPQQGCIKKEKEFSNHSLSFFLRLFVFTIYNAEILGCLRSNGASKSLAI